jgi:hypothetical protein
MVLNKEGIAPHDTFLKIKANKNILKACSRKRRHKAQCEWIAFVPLRKTDPG